MKLYVATELHTPPPGPLRGVEMSDTGRIKDAGLLVLPPPTVQRKGEGWGGGQPVWGTASDMRAKYPDAEAVEVGLITPGLVDCHTHAIWAGDRSDEFVCRCSGESYQEIAAAGGGILSTMRAVREASVEELAAGLISRAQLMLSLGTTVFEVKASYGLSLEACRKELDAIQAALPQIKQKVVVTFMGAHAFPPEFSREDYLRQLEEEILPMAAEHPVGVTFNDVFCEEGAFSVEESERVLRRGLELGLRPKIHSDEFNALGGTEMACSLGAVSCDHLLASGDRQIEALANSDTLAVTMPGTAFYLNKPYADARRMVDAGCAVAIGTDFNPGSSMVASMAFSMGLAVSRMGLSPEEALAAATSNAASAIGMKETSGFCIWPCETLEQLMYEFSYIKPETVIRERGHRDHNTC